MSRMLSVVWMVSLLAGCQRSAAVKGVSVDAGLDAGAFAGDARERADSGVPLPTIEQVEAFLKTLHQDRLPHTPEDSRVVSFVDKFLDQMKSPFPRPRMFLIEKRGDRAWVVTILDLEHLRKGGSGGDISVHVSEKQRRLAVDDVVGGY